MIWEKTAKHLFISDDGYYTFFKPYMVNTIVPEVWFSICFLQIEGFYLFLKEKFC